MEKGPRAMRVVGMVAREATAKLWAGYSAGLSDITGGHSRDSERETLLFSRLPCFGKPRVAIFFLWVVTCFYRGNRPKICGMLELRLKQKINKRRNHQKRNQYLKIVCPLQL